MNKNQKGFAILETLLILIIIATICGIGWYAVHTKHQTDKILAQSDKISQSPPVPNKKSSVTSSGSVQSYLTIKEWGVRAPLKASLTPEYSLSTQEDWNWAYFSSKELNLSDPQCTTDGGYGGLINRLSPGQHLLGPTGVATDQTIEQAISTGSLKKYTRIGNYYYYYEHPQAACGASDYSVNIQQETEAVVQDIANNLQAIPK